MSPHGTIQVLVKLGLLQLTFLLLMLYVVQSSTSVRFKRDCLSWSWSSYPGLGAAHVWQPFVFCFFFNQCDTSIPLLVTHTCWYGQIDFFLFFSWYKSTGHNWCTDFMTGLADLYWFLSSPNSNALSYGSVWVKNVWNWDWTESPISRPHALRVVLDAFVSWWVRWMEKAFLGWGRCKKSVPSYLDFRREWFDCL